MSRMPDAAKQIEADVGVAVVLPPLEPPTFGGGSTTATPTTAPSALSLTPALCRRAREASAVERFTLPNLPAADGDTSATAAPLVTWPECAAAATRHACAEAAEDILRQLSLERTRMIALTSPGDGDGKTGVLIALAPELAARTANSILVVDANFRKPDLTARLRVPADNTADCQALIYPTNLPRLSFLPAPAAARAQSRGFDPFRCEELRQGWSLVLLDTPSLAYPEAAWMTRRCDGVYLVVRLGHTARRAVAEAAHVVRACGGRLLGCLVVK